MPDTTLNPIAAGLRRSLRGLVVATVVLYLALAGIAGYAVRNSAQTHDALCALRSDVTNRIAQSEQFLVDHPHSHFTDAIKVQIENQQRTVDALDNLSC